ncbi:MAG: hypothetical protein L3J95_00560 [Thermoplasmata archaeon]|nr:hypothetical protein [Thermoplasmata archaeon]MCI4358910.1 hypothetical protein [Thermoplasmata archaeon]
MADVACPVCDNELSQSPESCPRCGFPTSLRAEAIAAVREGDPYVRPAAAPYPSRKASVPKATSKRLASGVESFADEVDRLAALLARLGVPSDELSLGVRRAAMAEIEGHPDEAIHLLKAANSQVSETIRVLLDRRVHDLDARQKALAKEGLTDVNGAALGRLKSAVLESRLADAADILTESEGNLTRVAEGLESVRIPLREIDGLLAILRDTGVDVTAEVATSVGLRAALSDPQGAGGDYTQIAERAEELRASLRERVPSTLLKELEQHESTLRPYPEDHSAATMARATHATALDHLEGGRLADAAAALQALRAEVEGLGPVPLPRVERQPAPPPPEEPSGPVTVPQLVQTARQLASRIRALDPGSELAFEAAGQIRQATDLLRARRLDEASETLHQLMVALDHVEGEPQRTVRT